jgi:hypothetical protein
MEFITCIANDPYAMSIREGEREGEGRGREK